MEETTKQVAKNNRKIKADAMRLKSRGRFKMVAAYTLPVLCTAGMLGTLSAVTVGLAFSMNVSEIRDEFKNSLEFLTTKAKAQEELANKFQKGELTLEEFESEMKKTEGTEFLMKCFNQMASEEKVAKYNKLEKGSDDSITATLASFGVLGATALPMLFVANKMKGLVDDGREEVRLANSALERIKDKQEKKDLVDIVMEEMDN